MHLVLLQRLAQPQTQKSLGSRYQCRVTETSNSSRASTTTCGECPCPHKLHIIANDTTHTWVHRVEHLKHGTLWNKLRTSSTHGTLSFAQIQLGHFGLSKYNSYWPCIYMYIQGFGWRGLTGTLQCTASMCTAITPSTLKVPEIRPPHYSDRLRPQNHTCHPSNQIGPKGGMN